MSPAADFIDGIWSVGETIKKISNKISNSIAILTNLGFIVDKGKSVLSAASSWKFEVYYWLKSNYWFATNGKS